MLAAAVLFALRLYGEELSEWALVPDEPFAPPPALAANAWADRAMWFSHPAMAAAEDPARWVPELDTERSLPTVPPPPPVAAPPVPFAVFFVHPTSYLERTHWNAPLDDAQSQARARLMVQGMASAFAAGQVWAPRYRQATFGAFLTDAPEGQQALDAAYGDVARAFEQFLAEAPPDAPIVLAGHSQGAAHVLRLLREKVAGTPLMARVAMAYPVGWPISRAHDLPALPLPACASPDAARCIAGWASFAEPADPGQFLDLYAAQPGLDGQPRGGVDPILCTNPLTGADNDGAGMERNLGTLVPADDLASGTLVAGAVPARCDPATGLLLIGDPPALGPYVLPGNNYHVYDIPLFWANLRHDVARRMQAFGQARP